MNNEESIIPQPDSTPKNAFVAEKSNTAQNAFWESILGTFVTINIDVEGVDDYRILQVDQFFVIVESVEGEILMLNKSSIISVRPPDTAIPQLRVGLDKAFKATQYKPSKEKTERNRKKLNNYTPPPRKEPRAVEVIVKKKRSYGQPDRGNS